MQVTHFKCGGVVLGVGQHHKIADGASGLHFINSWSEIARGLPNITLQPFFDRTLLCSRNPPTPNSPHNEYQPYPTTITTTTNTTNANIIKVKMFKITSQHLTLLKSKVNTSNNYTTFSLLSAHIWKCACIARDLPSNQQTLLQFPTDGRTRLKPALPEGYIGNVIFNTVCITDVEAITCDDGLEQTASLIQEVAKRMDDEYLRSALDYLEMEMKNVENVDRTIMCPNVGIVSWQRLKIHDADFGWGRPAFMGPGWVPCEGLGFVLPSVEGDGSLLLVFGLKEEHMVKFEKLLYEI